MEGIGRLSSRHVGSLHVIRFRRPSIRHVESDNDSINGTIKRGNYKTFCNGFVMASKLEYFCLITCLFKNPVIFTL